MTIINIFFVCSAEDLHDDILEVKDFIRQLNDRYSERSLQFKITVCEDENAAASMERQKKDDQGIYDSQLFVIMMYKNAKKYIIEKFDVAYRQFQLTDAPAILTFFRTDESKPTAEVQNFMDRLDQELGHYFKRYSDIDAMKLYLLMQIMNMGLDTEIDFHDGQVYITGDPILSLDHLPELAKNVDLRIVQGEIDKAEQEYVDARNKFNKDDNEDNFKALEDARKRKEKFIDKKKKAEKSILRLTQQMVAACVKGDLTPRQQQAIKLLEQGDSRAAYETYDIDDICADFEQAYSEMQAGEQMVYLGQQIISGAKEKAAGYVEEILEKIDILMTFQDMDFREKHYEAEKLYDVAIKKEEETNLDRIATKKYMEELLSWIDSWIKTSQYYAEEDLMPWKDIEHGVQLAHKYLQYERSSDIPRDRVGEFLSALLLQKGEDESKEEAESILRDLLSTCTEPQEEARLCHHLANGLENIDCDSRMEKNQEEILRFRRRALEITRELAKEDPEGQEENLAVYCRELMYSLKVSHNEKSKNESKELEHEWVLLNLEMAKRNPTAYRGDPDFNLEQLLHSILPFCSDSEILNAAEEYFRASLEIDREMLNPVSYMAGLQCGFDFYYFAEFLSFYRSDHESHQEAEKLYDEALKMEREIAQDEGGISLGEVLAEGYCTMAEVCESFSDAESQREAEILFRVILKIRQGLANEISADYKDKVASSCNDLAAFLAKNNDKDKQLEAEKLYKEALEIRRKLEVSSE